MGSFPFDIRLVIKSQLLENLKLLRYLYVFLTETRKVPANYGAFAARCKALSIKPEYGNLHFFMEDYLIPKANNFMTNVPVAQPLSLIPEIAEIDKLSDRGGKDKQTVSPERPPKSIAVNADSAVRSNRFNSFKNQQPTPGIKGSQIQPSTSPETPRISSLKTKVVGKLEEKWNIIAQISNIQKEDEQTIAMLKTIEVSSKGHLSPST